MVEQKETTDSDNVRLQQRIRELEAQVQLASQRESFARAMHDELGAEVSSIVRLATPMPGLSASEAAQRLSRVGVIARELSHSVRDSIWAATPEHDNLEETLSKIRDYAARFLSDAGIQRSIIIPEDPPARRIPGEFRKGVFLIIKEALHNAVKHGDATEVSLTISVSQNLTIELSDNGVGFDSTDASPASKGRGLKDMRMRAAGLGGSFQIVSVPREGTRITVTVPLE